MGAKRYFWIRLMSDFFEKTEVRLIEKAPNGKEIILLYLKLLCKAIESKGYLLFNGKAYNEDIISLITDTDIDTVRTGLSLLEDYGLIERRDNVFYMPQIETAMETETYWAEIKRKQRKQQQEKALKEDTTETESGQSQECVKTKSRQCKDNVQDTLDNVKNVSHKEDIDTDIETDIEIEIDTDTDSDIEKNTESNCLEQVSTDVFIELPLNDGSCYQVSSTEVTQMKELYPNVDVEQEYRNMKGWLIGNPTKKKTRRGIGKFINNWLSRNQDSNKGGSNTSTPPTKPTGASSGSWSDVSASMDRYTADALAGFNLTDEDLERFN